jgi:UDP:flavonoid glycosyltransferase YjiC (YdhE family)
MSSVLIASVPIHGHVGPLLGIARTLVERGDRVRFLTGARFAGLVTATGAEHIPLPPEADYDDRLDWDEVYPERARLSGPRAAAHDIEHIMIRPAAAQRAGVLAAHAVEPADVLLAEPAFAGAAFLVEDPAADRPPIVMCGVLPLMIVSRDTAPFALGLKPLPGPMGHVRNALLTKLLDRLVYAGAKKLADDINTEIHGRPLPFAPFDWPRHADAAVQFTVPEFEYPRSDAPANLYFAGPLSATGSTAPIPDWWEDMDGTRPVVHVTQGTIANKDFTQLVGPALEALAGEDVLVVVATGGRPLDELPPLPDNARAAVFLPYDDLLPRADVFVTNGGYGGVQYALRYGVPVVATGGKEDKPEVGARIEWSGVGQRFRAEQVRPAQLRGAVRAVLNDDRYRTAARAMADRMATIDGMAVLAGVIDKVSSRPSHVLPGQESS